MRAVRSPFATAAVTADYVHREKRATPREGMTVGKSRLKWSNIGYADAPVPAEIEALARDMDENGLRDPVEVLPDGTLVTGHQRVRAAGLLGWEEIDVVVRHDLADRGDAAV